MAKSDYEPGNVELVIDGKPITRAVRINPSERASGTVFRRQYENTAEVGVTAPTNVWHVPITDADLERWGPFNRLEVKNKGNADIDVRFNGSTSNIEIVDSLTSKIWGKDDNQHYSRIDIYNRSGVIAQAIGEIIIIVSRVN